MKRVQFLAGILAMLALVMSLLLTSFQLAIYGDKEYRFYEREYEKYQVAQSLNMEMPDIMDVTDKMMAYLIGEEPELSVVTQVDGKTQDFFNDQDRFHMGEVKDLFLGGLRLRNGLVILSLAILLMLVLSKADIREVVPKTFFIALGIFGVLTAITAGLFASDFNKYFTIFHEIFFDNDLWLFDPATDYMIRMLPEGFFYDFVFRIVSFFVAGLAILGVFAEMMLNANKKKR